MSEEWWDRRRAVRGWVEGCWCVNRESGDVYVVVKVLPRAELEVVRYGGSVVEIVDEGRMRRWGDAC
jgi:hypothetical protein